MGQEGEDEHGAWTGSCRGASHLWIRLRHSGCSLLTEHLQDKGGQAGCHGVRWTVICSCFWAPGYVEVGGLVMDCSGFQPSVLCSLTLLRKADILITETGMTNFIQHQGAS